MRAVIKNLRILPRWVILCLDLIVVFFSYLFAVLVRFNFELAEAAGWFRAKQILVYLIIHLLFMFIFRTYVGIIRYTHKEDIVKIIKFVGSSMVVLAMGNIFIREVAPDYFFELLGRRPKHVIPYSILIIGALTNSALLSGYRFFVKEFYDSTIAVIKHKKRVAVYGAGNTGRTASRIMAEKNSHYLLKFFIDDDPNLKLTTIQGKNIHKPGDTLKSIPRIEEVDELILAVQDLSQEKRNWIIEECINLGITIKEVPDPNRWVGGHLSERQFRDVRIDDLLGRNPIILASESSIKTFSGKRIWVTGAAGSIGSELSRQLIRCGVLELVLIDQSESNLYDLQQSLLLESRNSDHLRFVICDVTKNTRLTAVFEQSKPDIIFHAAAYKHVPLMEEQPIEAIETNILGTKYLADLAHQHAIEKFIFVSTDKAVNPTNVMGATKRAAELYIQSLDHLSNVDFITTRFGNVLGSSGSVIPLITRQIQKGGPVTITHPEIRRFFMTIPEACSLVLEAGAMAKGGEIFVFDMGEPVKIVDLANKMIRLAGLIPGSDIELKFIGLRPGEKLYEEVLFEGENLLETHHPKIRIAQISAGDYNAITSAIEGLSTHIVKTDDQEAVTVLKTLVPEFRSQMSRFSVLDKKR